MSRTILLADDSVTIQKVVELTFMDEDYVVIAVSNGDDALKALADLSPDLVITDLHMPGAGGFEVSRQAKAQGLPVLLLVGTFEPFQQDEADAAGVDGVVKKPFDSQELLQRVGELMSQSEAGGGGDSQGADEDADFEIETSPWEDAAEHAGDQVDVVAAEGLISTDTIGAAAHGDAAHQEVGGSGMDDDGVDEEAAYVLAAEDADGLADDDYGLDKTESMPVRSPISERFAAISGEMVAEGSNDRRSHDANGSGPLSSEDVDRVAKRVVELLSDGLLREVAWEVVPDLAEVVIRDRIRELERQIE